ncbi:MAG: hypothetical protein KME21_31955 [Desmonostoc vinosum HA7617-LM4]|jgi:hypothetical protein|nr:hypothetical protein [Desmonostoc vinosum HA7617-LM4]
MITTRLTPNQASISSIQQAYQEAKIDYQILEQKIRNTSVDEFNVLVQLNHELAAAAQKMEAVFDDWSNALDAFVTQPLEPDPLPAPGLKLIGGWLYDSYGGRTLVVS